MLKRFHVRNYKAFPEATVELRPLTLLLGPNNSGKTCLIEVLLLMQQTLEASQADYPAPIKLNGPIVSLGSIEHLYHNGNIEQPITLGFQFVSQNLANNYANRHNDFTRFVYGLYRDYFRLYTYLAEEKSDRKKRYFPDPEKFWLDFDSVAELKKENAILDILENLSLLSKFDNELDGDDILGDVLLERRRARGHIASRRYKITDLRLTSELLLAFKRPGGNTFALEFDISYIRKDKCLTITRIQLSRAEQVLLEISLNPEGTELINIRSDVLSQTRRLKNYYTSIMSTMNVRAPLFSIFRRPERHNKHQISVHISDLYTKAMEELSNCFSIAKLSHVSPIRAYPRRFYLADQGYNTQLDGSSLIEILRDNEELKKRANDWLHKFGIVVDIERLREVLYRLAIRQEGVKVDLDITDVGFGVSQVLPVIVNAFLNPSRGLSLVEQPEIHLHPKMQAELTDFFIDVITATRGIDSDGLECAFIIETHSLSLLRRLRTRLASKSSLTSSDNVAIYNISCSDESPPIPTFAPISADGKFTWPKDFLEAELQDTMDYFSILKGE